MNFIIKLISTFSKSYWTGCTVVMRAWYKLFGANVKDMPTLALALLSLIIFVVVAVKWGFIKAIMCVMIFTMTEKIALMVIGWFHTAKTGESMECVNFAMEVFNMNEDVKPKRKPSGSSLK